MIKLFHRTQAIEDNPITYPPAYYDVAYQASFYLQCADKISYLLNENEKLMQIIKMFIDKCGVPEEIQQKLNELGES